MVEHRSRAFGVAVGLLLSLSLTVAHDAAASRDMRCKSYDYRYNYCRVDTDNRVRLLKTYSHRPCRLGKSWGYDRRGVWVDNGCDAKFEVGGRHGGGGWNGGGSRPDGGEREIPAWAIGKFKGYNEQYRAQVKLRIHANGKVDAKSRGMRMQGHFNPRKQVINLEGTRFRVNKERGGLRTKEIGRPNNVVHYRRID